MTSKRCNSIERDRSTWRDGGARRASSSLLWQFFLGEKVLEPSSLYRVQSRARSIKGAGVYVCVRQHVFLYYIHTIPRPPPSLDSEQEKKFC